ncbi:MAG: dihydroneopterin aldolase [Armatimonadota bacterium]
MEEDAKPDTILIEGITFHAYHGASDEEQAIGHRYSVDVVIEFDIRAAARSDDLSQTVNYSTVAKRVLAVGTENRFRLIETLAEHIAADILQNFPASAVEVTVRKLLPPMKVPAQAVGVKIRRAR